MHNAHLTDVQFYFESHELDQHYKEERFYAESTSYKPNKSVLTDCQTLQWIHLQHKYLLKKKKDVCFFTNAEKGRHTMMYYQLQIDEDYGQQEI